MSWISKFLGLKSKQPTAPAAAAPPPATAFTDIFAPLGHIRFGRYGDNNKSYTKAQQWYHADELFREKKYNESFCALFDYMRDDVEDNIHFTQEGDTFTFDIRQGSRQIHGSSDGRTITAQVPLAVMDQPVTATMRRLLDMNFSLFYSRAALDDNNTLYMLFDTDVATASPDKLYYGLREMAIKADRHDDLLLADFSTLRPAGEVHMEPLPQQEVEVKYTYFKKWIGDTLRLAESVNQDSFAGAIAYLLLGLLYRIDFLITPEGKLLLELERINAIYWEKKEELPLIERNAQMKEGLRKLQTWTQQQFAANVFRSKATYSVNTPARQDKVKDHIFNANKDARWYADNKYPEIALQLNEYGLLYNQFIFNMPRVQTDLTLLYMAVLHAYYFKALGMTHQLYNPDTKEFDKDTIGQAATEAVQRYTDKYTRMRWDTDRTAYNSLYDFGVSFSEQIANLNLETKR